MLDEVDIISSVSGGSFTAAYFVLYRDRIFEGSYERNFLKKNIQRALFYELLSPGNWLKLAGASYYWFFTVMMLITAIIFIFVAAGYREKTYIQDEGGSGTGD